MTLHDIVERRLYNQQLSTPTSGTPAEVVRRFGGLQAQDLFASLYAIGRRMAPGATETAVEQAIANKTIARSWPMRGTIHFTAPEDMRWMTALLAERIVTKAASNYRRAEITPNELTKTGEILANILRGTQLTRPAIYEAFNKAGIDTSGRNGEQRGMHFIVHWACRGLLCTAPRQGKQQSFALMHEWLPDDRGLTGQSAIIDLGARYFASHGPATIKDFMWWTGLTMAEIKPNILSITKNLQHSEFEGKEYWFSPETSKAPEVILLSAFDEYTIAYADRSAAIDPSQLRTLSFGLSPNVIVNGRVAGTWRRTLKKDEVIITTNLITSLKAAQQAQLQQAVHNYGAFLERKAVLQ